MTKELNYLHMGKYMVIIHRQYNSPCRIQDNLKKYSRTTKLATPQDTNLKVHNKYFPVTK